MRIAVVDDERPARSELVHQILTVLPDAEISQADSGASALELFSANTFDILFLDINLNDIEGTSLAVVAKRMFPKAKIIFATAYSDYAVKAFELGVDNYILKPFDPERIRQILTQYAGELEGAGHDAVTTPATDLASTPAYVPVKASAPARLAVNTNRKTIFVDMDQIAYIETSGKSCIIHTMSGDYVENLLLGDYEKKLSPHGFFRIHKSYLINLAQVAELFPWSSNSVALKMKGFEKDILPVSREKVRQLRELLHL